MKRVITILLLATAMLFAVACSRQESPGVQEIAKARDAYAQGFYLEAEQSYERYLQLEPQGSFRKEAWTRLSQIAVQVKEDYDRAVVLLEAMYLELGNNDEEAWNIMFQLGDMNTRLGDTSKALESYEKCLIHALENREHTFRTQLRMAKLYQRMGNYDLVSATLENCADSAVNNEAKAQCLYQLAQSYSHITNWNKAKRSLESLLELDDVPEEKRALAIFLLADFYENERDYLTTRQLLESIKDTYPNSLVIESRLAALPYVAPKIIAPPPPPERQ